MSTRTCLAFLFSVTALVMAAKAQRAAPAVFHFSEYPLAQYRSPEGIARGPDGAVWFGEYLSGLIGRITTSGSISEYSGGFQPINIAAGPDHALWYTEFGGGQIGRITPRGAVTQYPIPSRASAKDIALGPDGALWFVEGNGWIGRITTLGVITEYPLPYNLNTGGSITRGPDGAMWFTEGGVIPRHRADYHGRGDHSIFYGWICQRYHRRSGRSPVVY